MDDLTLHEMHVSGNCYKVRLVASILGLKLKLREYNTLKGETRTQDFTSRVNANGRIPVLQIGQDIFLPESDAACYYLADMENSDLIPKDKLQHAQMLQWLFFEQYSHEPAIAVLRFWRTMKGLENLSEVQKALMPEKERQGAEVLGIMESHLYEGGKKWFAGDQVSLADLMLFAYTHCADEAGFDLGDWPNVKAWVERVQGVKGFIPLND